MLCFFPFIGSQSALIATHKQLLLQFAYTSAHRLCSIKVFCPNFMKPYIQLKTYIETFFLLFFEKTDDYFYATD